MDKPSGNSQHKRLVKLAVEEFYRKLREKRGEPSGQVESPAGFAPEQVVASEPIYEEPKLATISRSPQKCFICGEMPISGVLMPTSVVLYFCEEHINSGRALADSAWEAQREKERIQELYEAWRAWRQKLLDRLTLMGESERTEVSFPLHCCENCGTATTNVLRIDDGFELILCQECAVSLGYKSKGDGDSSS